MMSCYAIHYPIVYHIPKCSKCDDLLMVWYMMWYMICYYPTLDPKTSQKGEVLVHPKMCNKCADLVMIW